MSKILLAAITLGAVLSPLAVGAVEESDLVRIYYVNRTPWTIKIKIDGRYAIETNSGYTLPTGSFTQRFAKPGLHIFEAYALERKYYADWVTHQADFSRYLTEDDLKNGAEVELQKELFEPLRGTDFVRANLGVLLNLAVLAALALFSAVVFLWSTYALLIIIKKSRP